jgi:hypothetical protein
MAISSVQALREICLSFKKALDVDFYIRSPFCLRSFGVILYWITVDPGMMVS